MGATLQLNCQIFSKQTEPPLKNMRGTLLFLCALICSSCSILAPIDRHQASEQSTVYQPSDQKESALARLAPLFIVEDSSQEFNKIGSPVAITQELGPTSIAIDSDLPALYGEEQTFTTAKGTYINLIYRVHFSGVPFSLFPFNVTAGRGAGLLVILTLNSTGEPLLISLVHTCGCFLAFIPTSHLDPGAFPPGWSTTGQTVYGFSFPGLIDYSVGSIPEKNRLALFIRSSTHRITDIRLANEVDDALSYGKIVKLPLQPMSELEHLKYSGGELSFFETQWPRKGYVRNSLKPLEALLMGWWTLDPYIGQDKALGPREKTGVTFYTSLKLWDREKSNLGDFASCLHYWGWGL